MATALPKDQAPHYASTGRASSRWTLPPYRETRRPTSPELAQRRRAGEVPPHSVRARSFSPCLSGTPIVIAALQPCGRDWLACVASLTARHQQGPRVQRQHVPLGHSVATLCQGFTNNPQRHAQPLHGIHKQRRVMAGIGSAHIAVLSHDRHRNGLPGSKPVDRRDAPPRQERIDDDGPSAAG